MKSSKLKRLPVLLAIFILISSGCTLKRTTHNNKGVEVKETSAFVKDSNEGQEIEEAEKENVPKVTEFIVGPGDTLQIIVYRNDDLTRDVWINPSGKIMYPLTGDIQASGLSIFKLRDRIRDGLSKYIIDPQVSVNILSIESQKIIVLGEVARPGFFLGEGSMTIVEVIARAGGVTPDAEQKNVLLIRGGMENPELRLLNVENILKKGDLTQNIVLRGGDIIYMPRTTISDVAKFFAYLSTVISPIVQGERGYLLGKEIVTGENTSVRTR